MVKISPVNLEAYQKVIAKIWKVIAKIIRIQLFDIEGPCHSKSQGQIKFKRLESVVMNVILPRVRRQSIK